ncbi:hypothetical protein PLANPX_2531 [Lacipirellula parvula]|uniref:Uncharacterized protein n=1 Tax=Lacipirellula parvula TaxID=2650471 RepID=A0A5K7XJ81_9BACT|nr:hypothetical protein PLANPX_2531 [Lacipirellula parvula]
MAPRGDDYINFQNVKFRFANDTTDSTSAIAPRSSEMACNGLQTGQGAVECRKAKLKRLKTGSRNSSSSQKVIGSNPLSSAST